MPGQTTRIIAGIRGNRVGGPGTGQTTRIPVDDATVPSFAGLLAWYDAQNINLLGNAGINDADPIGTWKNAAATGATYDMVQATAGKRPTFRRVAASGKINNLSAAESTDGLRHMATGAFTLTAQPLKWAWLFRNTATGTQVISSGGAANTNQTLTQAAAYQLFAGTTQSPALVPAANTWEAAVARFDGASSTLNQNGVGASGFGTLGTLGIDQIGCFWNPAETAAAGMIGFLAEMLVWAPVAPAVMPTDAEIIAYFAAKYGATPQ